MPQYTAYITVAIAILLALAGVATAADNLTVTAVQADVRAGPGITHAILTTLPTGAIFSIVETQAGWHKILLADGREGWVAQAMVQVQGGRALTVPAVAAPPPSSARTALVIGNAAYGTEVGPLQNPGNDATDIAAALRQLGFEITLVLDANRQRLEEAVEAFSRQLRRGGVGLFYFSGHGAQVEGTNYLIPVGARLAHTADVKFQAVAAEWVLASMEDAGNGLNIVILDACRNAPFARQWRSAQRGLAAMQAAHGSLIAYATAPGSVAADGTGRNGTYTKHLLQYMTVPDLPVEQMFKQVRLAVEQETKGAQTPWELSSLRGDFFFRPETGARPSPAVPETPGRQEAGGTQVAVGTYPQRSTEPGTTSVGKDGAEMVLVPAGEFVMGSDADEIEGLLRQYSTLKRDRLRNEIPKHRVFLEVFYIDKYEVTNARFQQFVQATGYRTDPERDGGGSVFTNGKWESLNTGETWRTPLGPGSSIDGLAEHPVVQVTWRDARAYCKWAGKRLPTEAEWEKAARGTEGFIYPWGHQFDGKHLNFCDRNCDISGKDATVDDDYRFTAPVGHYEAGKSPYGVYDMAGNAWEWVEDGYDEDYYMHSPDRNPPGPAPDSHAVLRGGSWRSGAASVRAARRVGEIPGFRNSDVGLRCAKSP